MEFGAKKSKKLTNADNRYGSLLQRQLSKLEGLIFVCACRNDLLAVATVAENHITLANHTSCQLNLSLDRELIAVFQGWNPVGNDSVHGIDELVTIIQLYERRHSVSLWRQLNAEILGHH